MLARTIAICVACLLWVTQVSGQEQDLTTEAEAEPTAVSRPTVALVRAPESAEDPQTEQRLTEIAEQLGYPAMSPDKVMQTLGPDFTCDLEAGCDLAQLRSQLGVDTVLLFLVEPLLADDTDGRARLDIEAANHVGERQGSVVLAGPDAARDIEQLLLQLLGTEQADAPTTVLLTTVPSGATVGIDEEKPQQSPARFQVSAGRHRITGELEGYRSVIEEVDIPAQPAPFAYQLTLPQSVQLPEKHTPDLGHDVPQARESAASPWNYILATGLGLGAAGLVTYAVLEARRDGECVERSAGREHCVSVADTQVAVVGSAVGASLSALAAAGLLIFEPLRIELSPEHAKIQVSHHF